MRLIITGGGTGGHLFPALAVARAVKKQWPQSPVLFIGTDRTVESQALSGQGFQHQALRCYGLKGMGALARIRGLATLPLAMWRARTIIRGFHADLVFSVGGYVTGPVVLAARSLGVPVCLHEQNSVPGLANRLAGRLANRICISMECDPPFPEVKTVLTGNPIREEIIDAALHRQPPRSVRTLVVLGGSQGARRVNGLMTEIAPGLADLGIRVIHQTGARDRDMVAEHYAQAGLEAEVRAFFTDMAGLYSRADLVVSRAGATTLAELAIMGLPALLIPYPHAADDHQKKNALWYAGQGGALVLDEKELSGPGLLSAIRDLAADPARVTSMGQAIRSMARPDATDKILEVCLGLIEHV